MSDVETWSQAAAGNGAAAPNGFKEDPAGMVPAEVNNSGRELMAALARWYHNAEFLNLSYGYVVTRASAITVRIAGVDQTALYETGMRVRLAGGAAAQYGFVFGAVFAAGDTIVTIVIDGLVPIDVATNEIRAHVARTARAAAWREVGIDPDQLPTADQVRTVCARNRAHVRKSTADQSITAAGVTQITLNGDDFIIVPNADGTLDFLVSCMVAYQRTATAGALDFKLTLHLGLTGTSADAPVLDIPVLGIDPSAHGVTSISDFYLINVPLNSRLSFSLNKVSGPAGVGLVVRGSNGGAKVDLSYFAVEEAL